VSWFEEEFEERRKRIMDVIRDAFRRIREMEDMLLGEALEERVLDERFSMLSRGQMDPLHSIIERDDEIVIVVELPGVREDTIDIVVVEDEVRVEARLEKELVRRALGEYSWYKGVERVSWSHKLPFKVDPSRVRVERRGFRIVIRLPKAG
jgi:HSP20 family molecular chaperone IbpA